MNTNEYGVDTSLIRPTDVFKHPGTQLWYGPPGCGKTESIRRYMHDSIESGTRSTSEWAGFSLTVTASKELASRVRGPGMQELVKGMSTFHAACFKSLGLARSQTAESDDRIEEWNEYCRHVGMEHLRLSLKWGAGDDDVPMEMLAAQTEGDMLHSEMQRLRAALSPRAHWPSDIGNFSNYWETWKGSYSPRLYDYNDFLYFAALETEHAPGNPSIIVVDEAQDMNGLMWRALSRWAWHDGVEEVRIVGDQDQALFPWSGARPDFLNHSDIDPSRSFILSQSHRVPRAAHSLAMKWIRQIKNRADVDYYPRDHDGVVRRMRATWKNPGRMIPLIEQQVADGKTVMILTSCSYMLTPILAAMKEAAIPFHNPYRRYNGAWNPLFSGRGTRASERLLAYRGFIDSDPPRTNPLFRWDEIEKFASLLRSSAYAFHGAKTELQRHVESMEEIERNEGLGWEELFRWFQPEAVYAMMEGDLNWLRSNVLGESAKGLRFPIDIAQRRGIDALRHAPKVIPATIHASKGTEADVVYLDPCLSRAAYERYENKGTRDEAIRQYYVGITRTADELYILEPATNQYVGL